MIKSIQSITTLFAILLVSFSSCKKEKYTFGDLKTPGDLTLTTVIAGVDASNPNGNGTGNVTITTTSTNTLNYNIDFGDGVTRMVPSGTLTYKYNTPGTNNFTITVNAIGTGGVISTISKTIRVFVAFEIPAPILEAMTNGNSKIWVTDRDALGHFGVGPNSEFSPIWYAARA